MCLATGDLRYSLEANSSAVWTLSDVATRDRYNIATHEWTTWTNQLRQDMSVADGRNGDENLLSAKRRRRVRSLETRFRFLSALVSDRPRSGATPEQETTAEAGANNSAGQGPHSDLRAALWLLRRSRK